MNKLSHHLNEEEAKEDDTRSEKNQIENVDCPVEQSQVKNTHINNNKNSNTELNTQGLQESCNKNDGDEEEEEEKSSPLFESPVDMLPQAGSMNYISNVSYIRLE